MNNTATILQSQGKRLCKIIKKDSIFSYDYAKYFTPILCELSHIYEMHQLLTIVSTCADVCLIRGAPYNEEALVRRLLYPDPQTGDEPAFFDTVRSWVMIDIDDLECPIHLQGKDRVVHAIHSLPPQFHDVTCAFQFSSSELIKDPTVVKVHLWYWLEQPMTCAQLKAWFEHHKVAVDCSLFNPVQIHYTANPVFVDVPDPVPQRIGLISGTKDSVYLESIPHAENAHVNRITSIPVAQQHLIPIPECAISADSPLHSALCGELLQYLSNNNVPSQRHKAIVNSAMMAMGYAKSGYLDWSTVRDLIADTAMQMLVGDRGREAAQTEISDILTYAESRAHPIGLTDEQIIKKIHWLKRDYL